MLRRAPHTKIAAGPLLFVMEEEEGIHSKTRTTVNHRGCCIEQTVTKTLISPSDAAMDDDDPSMHPRRRSKMVQVTPIHYDYYEEVMCWIQPEPLSATDHHHDQIIQMYHPNEKMALTAASRSGYDDYRWVMDQVRKIEAKTSRENKELKEEVAELKREVQRYKEELDAMQHKNKGKVILGMVAEVLPVPGSIRTTLSRLIDLVMD